MEPVTRKPADIMGHHETGSRGGCPTKPGCLMYRALAIL